MDGEEVVDKSSDKEEDMETNNLEEKCKIKKDEKGNLMLEDGEYQTISSLIIIKVNIFIFVALMIFVDYLDR